MPLHPSSPPHKSGPGEDLTLEKASDPRKRLFIGLILGASVLLSLFLVILWVIPYIGLKNIHAFAPIVLAVALLALISMIMWSSIGLVLNILLGRSFPLSSRFRGITIKLFLPLMTLLGRFFNIPKDDIRLSFIKVNNELVASERGRFQPHEILLLLPHCLQNSRCPRRLTYDIKHCKRCGECPIDGLLGLSEKYGIKIAIATGGTIARRIVVQNKPKLIIAVACDRDLSSGIQDTYPIPVYGVLNQRPFGPCLDTLVDLPNIESALERFLAAPAKS
ncbi:hypothetical protein SAMN05660653_00763 [Desulfonatronum thiosulfatophilum]|uniref:DUF116 domain-containing protein n=1 Tax=Desulfonatronum thiosulfatophilum TaxID=617002 RepID=A0A1G6B771_9BACT|nr:DUF116 domain-containing protein [Desulfonatronum thiosulfatophilum]SDB16491.1 hypothetical protein SAMN05660653_00763 [Desulfonatronum thiosulfatophilum]